MAQVVDQLLAAAAAASPEHEAIRYRRSSWSYGRLDAEADALAGSLIAEGIRVGDRVGLLAPKRPEAIAAFYGVVRAGAVWVPIDANAPAAWVQRVMRDCGLSALITTPGRAREVLPAADVPPLLVLLPFEDADGSVTGRYITWDEVRDVAHPWCGPASPVSGDDLAAIFYTSGSTGAPKGVMHDHRSLLASATWFAETHEVGPGDRIPVFPPLQFKMSMYGIASAAAGGATSILASLETGFRGIDLARLVGDEQVTIWRSVPHPVQVLAAGHPEADSLSSLRAIVVGGGGWRAADIDVMRRAAPLAELWQQYGTTESGTICARRIEGAAAVGDRQRVGPPVEDVEVVLLSESGELAPPGEEGEMVVSSPKVMRGYWGDAEGTRHVLVDDPTGANRSGRWYRTGDLVRPRPDGEFEFVGRRDEMVKSRGYRIELGQVEIALSSHPAVRGACAVAIRHAEAGSLVIGFVELDAGDVVTEGGLRRHVAEQLPVYMVPTAIHVVDQLPRTSGGKPDRVRMASLAVTASPDP